MSLPPSTELPLNLVQPSRTAPRKDARRRGWRSCCPKRATWPHQRCTWPRSESLAYAEARAPGGTCGPELVANARHRIGRRKPMVRWMLFWTPSWKARWFIPRYQLAEHHLAQGRKRRSARRRRFVTDIRRSAKYLRFPARKPFTHSWTSGKYWGTVKVAVERASNHRSRPALAPSTSHLAKERRRDKLDRIMEDRLRAG